MDLLSQANRPMRIETPLGENRLLLIWCQGREAISELFDFELELLAPRDVEVPFDKLLGQPATVTLSLPDGTSRVVNGILAALTEGKRDETFTRYRARLVPKLWLWRLRSRSRTFQHQTVPEILRQVLDGLDLSLRLSGKYEARDYCVQYNETDLAFASRLMEDEGIFYFFEHAEGRHTLVVTDSHAQLPALSAPNPLVFEELEGGVRKEPRVGSWRKTQALTPNKHTLWDHCFQLTGKNLEAVDQVPPEARCGQVTHKLSPCAQTFEVYEYPGGYADRYDDVDAGGREQADNVANIFTDNKRTAQLRSERTAATALEVEGTSNAVHFLPGHRFTLTRHHDGDGEYLLTAVEHSAELNVGYRSDGEAKDEMLRYENRFVGLPTSLKFRPARRTPKPVIHGVQTATVVGPEGEEIYVDKYGRVKVQFHWDREGKQDVNSSCWIRVAQVWAGSRWGAFFWPRIGHEVVVAFAEGNPDQPLVVGSVYNSANMPALELPANAKRGGIKSCIFGGDPSVNFNAVVFHDGRGAEYVQVHSETHELNNAETDKFHYVPQAQYSFHGGIV